MTEKDSLRPANRPAKTRLDQLLVDLGLAPTRTRAQSLILAGRVYRETLRLDKPGMMLPADASVRLEGDDHPWVSRGGLKLVHALDHFALDPTGAVAVDVGASTGGFTDVLLTRGAAHVFAVDVGHGQLAWKLRQDPRVTVLERVNARHLGVADIPRPPGFVVCDASFIGLATVLPAALALASPGALLVALIKPQFEVGPENVGKGGVVRDPDLHAAVCARVRAWLEERAGWSVLGIVPSPVLGPAGNVEFLIAARERNRATAA